MFYALPIDMTVAATADDEREFCHGLPGEWKIIAAYFTPATAVTAHASNNFVASLKAGAGGTTLGSMSTDTSGGASLVKGTPTTIAISELGATLEFGPTDALEFAKVEGGTGAALDGCLTCVFQQVRV